MPAKITRWLLFSGLLSLAPIVFVYLHFRLRAKPTQIIELLGEGDLFILVVALCASSVGEVLDIHSSRMWQQIAKYVVGVSLVINVLLAAFCFGDVFPGTPQDGLSAATIGWTSVMMFLFAIGSGIAAIILSETQHV